MNRLDMPSTGVYVKPLTESLMSATPATCDENAQDQSQRNDTPFWWRFGLVLPMLLACNIVPLLLTWRAYQTDGMEQVGWPFTVYARGGFSYHEVFDPVALLCNLFVACLMAALLARTLPSAWWPRQFSLRTALLLALTTAALLAAARML